MLPEIRVAAVPKSKSIMVHADGRTLVLIAQLLHEIDRADPPDRTPRAAPMGGDSALEPAPEELEVIRLKHAKAEDAAAFLTEIYGKDRVRVVAENASNSLVIMKASPSDLLTVKSLIGMVIDVPPNPKR
jgi:hypothetical protein